MDKMTGFEPVPFGKYLLIEKIGAGGMAEIFKAKTFGVSGFEKVVVIKRILPKFSSDNEFKTMFVNEAKLTAGLQHNNIVQIYELGEIDQQYFIAMEYIEGRDLLHLLRKSSKQRQYIPLNVIIFVLKEIFTGLGYAHTATDHAHQPLNIIHRDISPSNILISYNGVVKISDFGIAKSESRAGGEQTQEGHFKGKLGYMSPEQILGGDLDSRADLFAGGIIAYELLTLARLFQGKSDVEILKKITGSQRIDIQKANPTLPRDLVDVINKILEKNPDERYQGADDIVEALDEVSYTNNLRITRRRFSEYLNVTFAEEIEESRKNQQNKSSYMFAKGKSDGQRTSTGYVTYIPKIEKDPEFSQNVVYLAPSRYVATDVNDAYFINDGKNPVVGPVTLGTIAAMVKERKIIGKEFFSLDGKDWKAIELFPEVKALVAMHASVQKKEASPNYRASLASTSFSRLLFRFFTTNVTGLVKLKNPNGTEKEIIFKKGQPIFIKSNKESELLGNYLLKEKRISETQLKEALNDMGNYNNRLGETLISKGFLQPFEVFELLSKQVKEKLYEVFTWQNGDFEFYTEFQMVPIVVPININFYETVLTGIIKYYPMDKLFNIFNRKGNLKLIKKEGGQIVMTQFKFPPLHYKLFNGIQYGRTIQENLNMLPNLNEKKRLIMYQLIYLLYEVEIITLVP